MRRPVSVMVCAAAALGAVACGTSSGDGRSGEPAVARDASVQAADPPAAAPRSSGRVLQGTLTRLTGERQDLARYRGDVVLVVNTASECGFTPQFAGLQSLYERRREDGLVLLGFPSDDFAQELESDADIASFCRENFGVTFPMFSRTKVTGADAAPLFRRLAAVAGEPEWNFNKFLLDRDGNVVARFGSGTEPDAPELTSKIDTALAAS